MNKLKLLTEWNAWEYNKEELKEAIETGSSRLVMKGILQKSNTLNQNGRVYPAEILEREVRNYQKFIKENRNHDENLQSDFLRILLLLLQDIQE